MADQNAERPELLVSLKLLDACQGLEAAEIGLLVTLIGLAANHGVTAIPVSLGNVAPELAHPEDRDAFAARFAALRLKGLVKPVRPGVFEIAPGYWKVAIADIDDPEFRPFPG